MKNCSGIFGFIFSHKYMPLITLSASKPVGSMSSAPMEFFDKFRDQSCSLIYCKRCGEVIKL